MFKLKQNFKSFNYKASRLVRKTVFRAFLEALKDQRSFQTFLDLKKNYCLRQLNLYVEIEVKNKSPTKCITVVSFLLV